jgi:hypothetical protein
MTRLRKRAKERDMLGLKSRKLEGDRGGGGEAS